ncbi:MAG TPA: SGNH/GDSL hydrolase N-terminal domain-containing protein, partial [Cyclobacteriaceae bacterium]|nr:SGNH/GDSL hydrolase N-terminal domain-containing protein [Cyclobacteriaceae bacterium]
MKTIFVIPFIILFGISGVTAHRFPYPDQEAGGKDENSIIWFDPRNEPFDLVGFEWIKADQVYRRLPLKPDWEIRKEVDNLANNTAGGQIRFRTDSKKILLRVELMHRPGSLYHMPATGVSGFDLYIQDGTEQRYVRTVRFSLDT